MKKLLKIMRAKLNNTFVADCPKCHKHFYGFNKFGQDIKIDGVHFRIVCHTCHKRSKTG